MSFVSNRDKIIAGFNPDQKKFVNAIIYVVDKARKRNPDKIGNIGEMSQWAAEYFQTLINDEDREGVKDLIIELSNTWQIAREIKKDKRIQSIAVGGELKIARLL